MFSVGDYVVCGNKGVCRVESISALDISGTNNEEDYYILKPVYTPGSTMYISLESAPEKLRPVLTKKEANKLVKQMAGIPDIVVESDKQLEGEYKNCIRSNDATELAKLLKTIYHRREARFAAGRKETALDAKYFRMAGDYLYGELAISLGIDRKDVENYIDKNS
ncbi:MAG: CarD family transcriptional regulator [Lachnospiraceae bacterium]|nr:CarD family transcriptional regulator [Lachnospiraceae bacterium]